MAERPRGGSMGKKFSITIQVPDDVTAQWPERSTAEKLISEVYTAMGGTPVASPVRSRARPVTLLLFVLGLFGLGVAGGYLGAKFSQSLPASMDRPVTAPQPRAEPTPTGQLPPSEPAPAADMPVAELAAPSAPPPSAPPIRQPLPTGTTLKAAVVVYKVQVGAFRVRENAELLVSQLREDGFKAHVFLSGNLYLVQIGTFQNRDGATRVVGALKAKRYDAIVVQLGGAGN